jgi:hypothetical protein
MTLGLDLSATCPPPDAREDDYGAYMQVLQLHLHAAGSVVPAENAGENTE